jgi:iron complex outermembrane receptor protein
MKQLITIVAVLLISVTAYAQSQVSGTVVDAENGQPLPGASVVVKGTSSGVTTDFDGNFSVNTAKSATLVISFIGYNSQEVSVAGGGNVGTISLAPTAQQLEGVMVIAAVAIDRKTPVAVSTIKAATIETKLGSQEFPEVLKSTPGVYATKSGGGFGDGRINLRGFNSENVAVLINGVPVNDMENGRVYWSNWAGLSDVTSSMQVQRGLGASNLAVPSIGGTINILSKTTDVESGGSVVASLGNDGYQKYGATVSTGLMDNGIAATVSAHRISGDGYVDGTQFDGYNYFVNLSKKINDNHVISLTSFGAPQRHGQRQNRSSIERYRNAESGTRFNPDWGMKNGQVVNIEDNFYHKSQTSLNHYWTINDNAMLSTALYASWGTGGGGGTAGDDRDLFNVRIGGDDQPVDLDNIVRINRERGAQGLGSIAYLRASRNDHEWYGLLSTLKSNLSENISILAGVDIRSYTGKHFSEVTDLLGGSYVYEDSDANNPNRAIKVGDKRDYWNDGEVGWQGLFSQIEFNQNNLSAFVSASVSNTSYRRVDYFNYTDSDPLQTTDQYNFMGFAVKGGANVNLDDNHNVFANVGYFEKAAGFDAVFQNYDNEHINENAENQKIFSVELGYGFRSDKLYANINAYRTQWMDRTFTRNFNSGGVDYFVNLIGIDAVHQGIEMDFVYNLNSSVTLTGMLSVGDWEWANDVNNVQVFDEDQNPVGSPINVYIEGLKVADAAQTTGALGLDVKLTDSSNLAIDYNYFGDIYADFDPNNRTVDDVPQAWKLPNYATVDANLVHRFKIGSLDASLIARMNNVLNTEYIADARDGNDHNAQTAIVWYGFGRTFSLSTKIQF